MRIVFLGEERIYWGVKLPKRGGLLHSRRRYALRTWRACRLASPKDADLRLWGCADGKFNS